MIELMILLSIVTLATNRIFKNVYIPYALKGCQVLSYLLAPLLSSTSFLSGKLNLDGSFNVLHLLLFIVVGLEAEHFKIKRWIKELLFVLFIVLTLTTSLPVVIGSVVIIFLLLMVSKKNRQIDFVNFSIIVFSFCLYFSELYGTYNNSFDKYVVYYNDYSSDIFPALLLAFFLTTLISMWGYVRSTSITPLLSSILLLIKFKSSFNELDIYVFIIYGSFLLYSVYNFKKYIVNRNLSSAVNVLFGLACVPVIQNVVRGQFELSIVYATILSIILYLIRLYNVEKFKTLLDYKTITIFFTLINLSFFPLGITGLSVVDSFASSTNVWEIILLSPLLFISWSVLYFSITDFQGTISFNLWEARTGVKFYAFCLLILTLFLSYINLSPLFIGPNFSRLLLRDFSPLCCNDVAKNNFGFNISLLINIILFSLMIYLLKIFKYDKIWKLRLNFISLLTFRASPPKLKKKAKSRFLLRSNVIDKIGQSSSFTISFVLLVSFICLLLVVME